MPKTPSELQSIAKGMARHLQGLTAWEARDVLDCIQYTVLPKISVVDLQLIDGVEFADPPKAMLTVDGDGSNPPNGPGTPP